MKSLLPSIILLALALILNGCSVISPDLETDRSAEAPELIDESTNQTTEETPSESTTAVIPLPIPEIEVTSEAVVIEPAVTETPSESSAINSINEAEQNIEYDLEQNALRVGELCEEIGNTLGSVSIEDCLEQNLIAGDGLSVLGRPLAYRNYLPLESRDSIGRVMVIGGIHGDEYSAVSITFKWMQILNEHHSGIFEWLFVPLSNPDGLLENVAQRQNANGVDLNRNFPSSDWNELALNYWRDRTGSNERRYPGQSKGSEPEVIWLIEQVKEFQPDVIISVHAPYHLVDYDGPPEAPERLGDLQLKRLGVFPGSLGNYAGLDLQKPVVTIELPYAGILPSESKISEMWTDLVAWLIQERSKHN